MATPIEVWLIHPDMEMRDAFTEGFVSLPNIRVIQSKFEDLPPHDCFVTAGNSFGIMNAGIDAAVVRFHGQELMHRIQRRIMEEFLGEQPIGTSMIEATGNPRFPHVAHTPTMRVPGSIEGTDKVYVATWAALVEVHRHNTQAGSMAKIQTVAFPNGRWFRRRTLSRSRTADGRCVSALPASSQANELGNGGRSSQVDHIRWVVAGR